MSMASGGNLESEKRAARQRARRVIEALSREPEAARRARAVAFEAVLRARLGAGELPDHVALFASLASEPAVAVAVPMLRARGVRCVLPRVEGAELGLHVWEPRTPLEPGRLGVLEPVPAAPRVEPAEIGLWLVPGLLFDPRGRRLGRGAGYYDRVLAAGRGRRIGVCHAAQIVDQVPASSLDVAMHELLSEAGVVDCAAPADSD